MITQHEIEIRVRYYETDAMGIVHHSRYLTYFELGRTEMLRAAGITYREVEESGLMMVIVRAECRYRKPARYDDLLRLVTKTRRVTAVKLEHEYQLFRDEELLVEGSTMLACVDRDGEICRVPEQFRTE
jgi:acyl-CoA thioester hydrolase